MTKFVTNQELYDDAVRLKDRMSGIELELDTLGVESGLNLTALNKYWEFMRIHLEVRAFIDGLKKEIRNIDLNPRGPIDPDELMKGVYGE